MKSLFELCEPRADVLSGAIKESEFAADLAQVLRNHAPPAYQDAATFFANTHPTEGLKRLLEKVCRRLSGTGGEASAIFRMDTQYGGGKTHALIALSHLARGASRVPNITEFLDPALLPSAEVRTAAFDGENADPVNARVMGDGNQHASSVELWSPGSPLFPWPEDAPVGSPIAPRPLKRLLD